MGGGYRVASLTLLAVALLGAAVAGPVVADEARSGAALAAYSQVSAHPPELPGGQAPGVGPMHAAGAADAGVQARKVHVRATAPGNRDGKVPVGGSVPGVRGGKIPVGGAVPGGRGGKVPVGGAVPGPRGRKLPRAGAMPQVRTGKVPDGRSVPGVRAGKVPTGAAVRAGKVSRDGSVAGVRVGQAPVPHVSIAGRPPGGRLIPKVTVPGMTIYPRAVCEGSVQVGQCSQRGTLPSTPRPPGAPPVVPARASLPPTPTPEPTPSLTPPARVRQAAAPPQARRKNPLGSVLVMVVLVTTIASTTAVAFGARR
ncbi:hypothetical protein ACBR40_37830 [Nonomuraea sp. AD125B]|uniref:hypothetical protein n=1 Tax=Nonomuraea sp. AD125B TaxID=3242897 RepID=UPI003528C2E2